YFDDDGGGWIHVKDLPTPRVILPEGTLGAGGSGTFPLAVTDILNSDMAEDIILKLRFDPSVLQLDNVTWHAPFSGQPITTNIDNVAGEADIHLAFWSWPDLAETTDLADLHFSAVGSPGAQSLLTADPAVWRNCPDGCISSPLAVTNGSITVAGGGGGALPVPDFTATPTSGNAPLAVAFDSSLSEVLTPTGYLWTFGDGNSSVLANPTFTYSIPGTYDVALQITNSSGTNTTTLTGFVTVTSLPSPILPIANFTADTTYGTAPLTVTFTDSSTNTPTSWNWSFGDGSFSELQNPEHLYESPGTFTVGLNVTNAGGSDSLFRTDYITATPSIPAPVSGFMADVTVGTVPLSVQFTDSSTGSPTAWKWSFGDGTSSELQNPEHHYTYGGIFTVSLNVTNAGGSDVLVRTNYITVMGSPAPASAVTITIDLDKTYKFSHANVSTIRIIDINNPELSKVEILSTSGDGSDVRTIAQPQIDTIRRIFTTTTGTFKGTTISVDNADSTISYANRPDYRIYIQPKVPTFKITAPGRIGNPVVLKYNESWDETDTSSVGALLGSSDVRYLYNSNGILYEDATEYAAVPSLSAWAQNKSDIPFTLHANLVTLDPFTVLSSSSVQLGQTSTRRANTGRYYAGAITHNEPAQTTTIDALTRVVALKSETPILWTDINGPSSLPMTYTKGQDGDVVLSFSGSNPDVPTSTGYVFINSTAHYNMNVTVDIQKLAQNADTRWSTLASNSPVIELLDKAITSDIGDAYTYNLTAVGQQTPPNANVYSMIAITP
ncbi:MAG: PKD domain-containing protein, partial [Methanoregula sp.]|nr:PKD domain-containing protein [Methanoregula sp.]